MGKQFKDLLGWVFNGADVRNRTAIFIIFAFENLGYSCYMGLILKLFIKTSFE